MDVDIDATGKDVLAGGLDHSSSAGNDQVGADLEKRTTLRFLDEYWCKNEKGTRPFWNFVILYTLK